MTQLRILRWGDYPGLSGWAQGNQQRFFIRRGEGEGIHDGRRPWADGSRDWSDVATNQAMLAALTSCKNKRTDFPTESAEGISLADPLILAPSDLWASDLQNGKMTDLACFKLNFLWFVTAAVGNSYTFHRFHDILQMSCLLNSVTVHSSCLSPTSSPQHGIGSILCASTSSLLSLKKPCSLWVVTFYQLGYLPLLTANSTSREVECAPSLDPGIWYNLWINVS